MKRHAKHIAAGGIVTPTVLGLAAAIANETQTAIGLHLTGIALALYIAAFVLGAAAVQYGQLRLEAQKILGELGNGELDLGALLGGLGSLFPTEDSPSSKPTAVIPAQEARQSPPPPPPPAP